MATIDLSRYTGAKTSSVLGYSATAGWTATAKTLPSGYDTVLSWDSDSGVTTATAVDATQPLTINAVTSANWTINDTNGAAKTINTGSGNDTVTVAVANAVVSTGNSNDKVSVVGALDGANINLGAGADTLEIVGVKVENSTIQLGTGSATVDGTTKAASVVGSTFNGTGANTINLAKLDESRINLGGSDDVVSISGTASSNTFVMGAGDDDVTINGASTENNFDLGAGDDELKFGATSTSDTVTMGAGNDQVTVTGVATGTKFDMGAGDDSVTFGANVKEVTITAGDGVDLVTVTGNVESSTIEMGAGNDSVTLGGTAKDTTINAGEGNDTVSLVGLVTDGKINAGAGNDLVTLTAGAKSTAIDLGAGNDTVQIAGAGSDTSITGGAGSDVFNVNGLTSGTATITDFQATTDLLVVAGTDYTKIANGSALKADGTIAIGASAAVQLSSSAGYYAVTADGVTPAAASKLNVLWTGEKAVEINASAINEPMVIVGTTGEGADTLRGGKKADTIVAGAGDVVFGGGGDDTITLGTATDDKRETVALVNGAGADSVVNFEQGFAATKDVIYLAENSIDDIAKASAFDLTGNLVVKLGTSKLDLGTKGGTAQELNVVDKTNKEYDVAVVNNGASYGSAATDVESMADYYIAAGDTANLSFSGISDTLTIELGNTGVYGGSSTFVGNFDSVTGGTTNTVIIGAGNKKETLTAGGGLTSLWGGGSAADSLIGAGATAGNKTTFFYRAGDGKDTVNGSNWGNGSDADVLDLTGVTMTSIKKDATNGMVISTNSDADKLTVQGVATENDVVKFTLDGTTVLQGKYGITDGTVTNNFTYDSNVSVYYGGKSDTLTVGSGITEANIQLDGSQGVGYAGITTVDASGNNGSIIIGGTGTANESIMAGTGSSSIWGGAGSSKDTLVGSGSGSTTFYWGTDNGNDTISSTTSSDKVFFYNISSTAGTVTDIKDTVDSDGTMVFTLASGEKLTLTGLNASAVTQFTFADGATYTYDYSAEAGKRWSVA
ncbi:MAG: hypothetical protein E7200_11510 [Selenomonas ruminantium]|nr:hypothetical protein [Selenomonas ruminantium]